MLRNNSHSYQCSYRTSVDLAIVRHLALACFQINEFLLSVQLILSLPIPLSVLPPPSDLELAYKLHLEAEQAAADAAMEDGGSGGEVEPSNPVDYSALYPGALATVKLDQMAEYGAIMDIVGQEDLVGLVHPHQGAADPELLGGEG
jgi:hypothetical protein